MMNDRFASLNLSKNQLQDEGVAILANVVRHHQTLTHLDLSTNAVGTPGAIELFRALEDNRSLTSLDLSSAAGLHRNHIGPGGVASLHYTTNNTGILARLILSSNGLGLTGARAIAAGFRGLLCSLTLLDVSTNDFGPAGAQCLADCLPQSSLETLLIGENALTDAGAQAISEKLPTSSTLRTLDLSLNDLTCGCLRPLLENVGKSQLRSLSLDKNDLRMRDTKGTDSWRELGNAPSLSVLSAAFANSGSSVPDIAESLTRGMHRLDLRGTVLGPPAVNALAPRLHKVVSCNLASCRLRDPQGVTLAELGLFGNETLTNLSLRDNSLGEAAGTAFELALAENRTIRTIPLELNALPHRSLLAIETLLARNEARWKAAQPSLLRAQITDLKAKQVRLQELLKSKVTMLARKAESLQAERDKEEELRLLQKTASEEAADQDSKYSVVKEEIDRETARLAELEKTKQDVIEKDQRDEKVLKLELQRMEARVWKANKETERMTMRRRQLEDSCYEQTEALHEELAEKTIKRNAAEQLAQAAQRNLDVFISSLEAVKKDARAPDDASKTAAGVANKPTDAKKQPKGNMQRMSTQYKKKP